MIQIWGSPMSSCVKAKTMLERREVNSNTLNLVKTLHEKKYYPIEEEFQDCN